MENASGVELVSENFLHIIDWSRPWLRSILPAAKMVLAQPDWRAKINQLAQDASLTNQRDLPLQFVPQSELPAQTAYESHIAATGQVPTRENLHDFFNALVWLSFPAIKRELNALQAAQIADNGIKQTRGKARDAATIFDENAAFLVAQNTEEGRRLVEQLQHHEWQAAFLQQRALFGTQAEVWCFGHALMEKLVQPYKSITAHAMVVFTEADFFAFNDDTKRLWLDQHIAQRLSKRSLSTSDFTPLPVAGVPGWWPEQDTPFYADESVFRARRKINFDSK